MTGYIGQSPGIGQTQYFAYTCTAGQTSFSGPDNNGYVLNYNVGFVDVYLNGRRLTPTQDYTATNGSSITLLAATSASDIVFVTALSAFSIANWITNSVNYVYIATAGQTAFTGVDSNSQTLSYVAGTIVVSVNGVILPQSDYAALDGLTVTLGSGVNAGDVVQIFSLRTINPVSISNWITNNLTNLVTYTYIATAGQTTFSGSAYSGGTLAYKAGCIQVTVNGLLLTPADYTATNGTSVVLNVGVNLDDTVVIWVYGNTTVAGVYTQAQSDAKYLIKDGPLVMIRLSGAQTLTHNAQNKITFNAEVLDTNNCFDPTTNYRFTPNVAGYYSVTQTLVFNGTSGRTYYLNPNIYKNGVSTYGVEDYATMNAGGRSSTCYNIIMYMNGSTDYLEFYMYPYDYTATSSIQLQASTTLTINFVRGA